ncbi:uncharacterized protein LOC105275202 isoform X2 [Ooceraea biroi]|uniref:uncharacterized protein LOC105275202 isoform X2 n=1 Tax=Ooceraea biroi TaxID=2015173 RepID=UPI000F08AF97|nr:uncharacterized protein LOC105275202 isoform X2 [Ooceraea biroi]
MLGRHLGVPISRQGALSLFLSHSCMYSNIAGAPGCVSDKFDIGIATAWRSVQKVVNALYKKVATFIRWPTLGESVQSCL